MENSSEIRSMVHEILNRNRFYGLSLLRLNEILRLLGMEEAREAKDIQAKTITGIIKLLQTNREKRQNYFIDRKYAAASEDLKKYTSKIISDAVEELERIRLRTERERGQLNFPFNPFSYMHFPYKTVPLSNPNMPYTLPYPNPYFYQMYGGLVTPPIAQPIQESFLISPHSLKQSEQKPAQEALPLKKSKRIQEKRQKRKEKQLIPQVSIKKEPKEEESMAFEPKQVTVDKIIDILRRKDEEFEASIGPDEVKVSGNIAQKQEQQVPPPPGEQMVTPALIEEEGNPPPPELQLKHYNSITDLDYKVFPYKQKKKRTKKHTRAAQTQTEINLITHDFRFKHHPNEEESQRLKSHTPQDQIPQPILDQKNEPLIEPIYKPIAEATFEAIVEAIVEQGQEAGRQLVDNPPVESSQVNLNKPVVLGQLPHPSPQQPANHILQQDPVSQEPFCLPPPPEQDPPKSPQAHPSFMSCPCKGHREGVWLACISCMQNYHYECLRIQQRILESFECPRCRLRGMDLFLEVKQILGEFYMSDLEEEPFTGWINCQELVFLREKGREELGEIEMRCIEVSYRKHDRGEITWPDESLIRINGFRVTEFYSLLKTSASKKRKDSPIIVTQSVFKMDSYYEQDYSAVKIEVQVKQLPPEQLRKRRMNTDSLFLLGIYYTRKYGVEQLKERIKASMQRCGSDFIQGLMDVGEEGVGLEREVFTITDPLSAQVIQLPVRGTACRHSQCFDLRTYLLFMFALKNRNWRCPVCSRSLRAFLMDGWVFELIQRLTLVSTIPSEVSFMKKGNIVLKILPEIQDQSSQESPDPPRKSKRIMKKNKRNRETAEQLVYWTHNLDLDVEGFLSIPKRK